jgi:hypothetical protein
MSPHFSAKQIKPVVLVCACIFALVTAYYAITAINLYADAQSQLAASQSKLHSKMIRTTAADGTELKALYFIDPELKDLTDHSIPLAILCHGMSDTHWSFSSYFATLTARGYAVLAPEFRGHGSNSAPSTLGYLEGKDIVEWLDYIEAEVPAINISASAIYGHSLGALFATNGYIIESHGQGRLKCLVEASGPVNLTREVDFLTNNVNTLGNTSLSDYMYEKNPINHVNTTFPSNIMVIHGDKDGTVDFQCAVDFMAVIDPTNSRPDVEYHPLKDHDHSIGSSKFIIGRTIYWFERFVRGIAVDPAEITVIAMPFSPNSARQAQAALQNAAIYLIMLLPCLAYLIRPSLFTTKNQTNDSNSIDLEEADKKLRLKQLLGFLMVVTVAGVLSWLIPGYIVHELIIYVSAGFFYLIGLWKFSFKTAQKEAIRHFWKYSFNPKLALGYVIALTIPLTLYIYISSSPALEDSVLLAGARRTWWTPYIAFLAYSIFIMNWLMTLVFRSGKMQKIKAGFIQVIGSSVLTAIGLAVYLIPFWRATYFIIPAWFSFNIDMVVTVMLLFGILSFLCGIMSLISEKVLKSHILLPLAIIIIVPMFLAETSLIFFY